MAQPTKIYQFSQFGDIEPGPQSETVEPSGHDWLDQRTEVSLMDAAFGAEARQKTQRELGSPWMAGSDKEWNGRFMTSVGERRSLDVPRSVPGSEMQEKPGLNWNVHDTGSFMEPVVRQEPVTHVFRGMSTDEFDQAQTRGFIQSDERGVISPGWEGTNAGLNPATANSYLPRQGPGRIVKIAVHPEDQWFSTDVDDYARTRAAVPFSRVEAFTSVMSKDRPSYRSGLVEQQKREGRA
jgi:hypothetical protein